MEETKKNKKLTYEQLETAAKQISAQLDAVVKENSQLREILKKEQIGNMLTELEFRFKVLNYADMFPSDFVESCVSAIVDVMTPAKEDTETEE